jgi:hypothetical protein
MTVHRDSHVAVKPFVLRNFMPVVLVNQVNIYFTEHSLTLYQSAS